MAHNSNFPPLDLTNPAFFLNALYEWTIGQAEAQIAWYDIKRTPMKEASQGIRRATVLLISLGALCPLFDAMNPYDFKFGQLGYLLLAMAGGLVSYDKFFGHSSAWIRFSLTAGSLTRLLMQFKFDWATSTAQQNANGPTTADLVNNIQIAKEFALQVQGLVKQETDAWATEFQTNLTELQKTLGSVKDSARLGAIRLTLTNGQGYADVDVLLNDRVLRTLGGVGEALLDAIPPGHYEVGVAAEKAGKKFHDTKVTDVAPGVVVSVEFVLPA